MNHLDDPRRVEQIKGRISRKPSLRDFYRQIYLRYEACLAKCPRSGIRLELGAGAGFAKDVVPDIITSDILPYAGVDCVVDGQLLPFPDQSLAFIGMVNVFHHVPAVEKFLYEAQRCLMPEGRLLIVDQHPGFMGKLVYKYLHREGFDPEARAWGFNSSGPLSSANGALAWIVFVRDRELFERKFPQLELLSYRPHTPLYYWLVGGVKWWTLVPGWGIRGAHTLDRGLLKLTENWGSFVDIELRRC